MHQVLQIALKVAGYLGCVVAGAAASWYFTKKHYEKLVDEEIESIREVHSRYKEEPSQSMYNEKISDLGYSLNEDHPRDDVAREPYLIPMETFDDADPSFEKICLEYYTEDGCLVEDDSLIDVDDSIGRDNLDRFAKRMDLMIMYVRNEKIGADYEVTKIVSGWN